MRQLIIFCVIALFLIACNNSSSSTVKQSGVDSVATISIDTIKIKDIEEPVADPMNLTAADIKDDSVFADGSIPISWANAGFDDAVSVKKFLKKIQYWVATNQKDSVAVSIAYPLRKPAIKNPESFLKNYDSLITEKVKKALRGQNLSQLFRNTQGAMIGKGEIWISQTPKGIKIIAINN